MVDQLVESVPESLLHVDSVGERVDDVEDSIGETDHQAAARLPGRAVKVSVDDRLQRFVGHLEVVPVVRAVSQLQDQTQQRLDFTR